MGKHGGFQSGDIMDILYRFVNWRGSGSGQRIGVVTKGNPELEAESYSS